MKSKNNFENAEIAIYDTFGRLFLAQKKGGKQPKIDISSLENGMYVYEVIGENAVLGSGKIMVQ